VDEASLALGLVVGLLVGIPIGWVMAWLVLQGRAASVVFDRDSEGRITGIHYVPGAAR